MAPRLSPLVVIPTYQELDNIAVVLRRVRAALPDISVLVVDDASPDGTADAAEEVGATLGAIDVMRRGTKDGLGSAYRDGFRWGIDRGHDALVEMDADLSHEPEALPALVGPVLADQADLAIGSRYVPGGEIPDWAWHRRLLSRWGNRYAATMLGLSVADATAGFRAYGADLLERIDLSSVRAEGYGFQVEMTYRAHQAGARIVEVPITFAERVEGTSKMSGRIVLEAMSLVTAWGVRRVVLRR